MNIALEETLHCKLRPNRWVTLLLLTAYRNLSTPYPMVPSPTLYDVPFSHNTNVTDRRTEHRTISGKHLQLTLTDATKLQW